MTIKAQLKGRITHYGNREKKKSGAYPLHDENYHIKYWASNAREICKVIATAAGIRPVMLLRGIPLSEDLMGKILLALEANPYETSAEDHAVLVEALEWSRFEKYGMGRALMFKSMDVKEAEQ